MSRSLHRPQRQGNCRSRSWRRVAAKRQLAAFALKSQVPGFGPHGSPPPLLRKVESQPERPPLGKAGGGRDWTCGTSTPRARPAVHATPPPLPLTPHALRPAPPSLRQQFTWFPLRLLLSLGCPWISQLQRPLCFNTKWGCPLEPLPLPTSMSLFVTQWGIQFSPGMDSSPTRGRPRPRVPSSRAGCGRWGGGAGCGPAPGAPGPS